MQIKKLAGHDMSLERCLQMEGWDRTFEFDGHTYAIIGKGNSMHTQLSVSSGLIPCFNLKSRTVRAVAPGDIVTPLKSEVQTRCLL